MPLRGCLLSILLLGTPVAAQPADSGDLIRVLQQRHCPDCRLADADLVHADLRDAHLAGARLQRANLGEARLDGADLSGSDLLHQPEGGPLRGADLRGSCLYGTDLRHADLSGARLDAGPDHHWQGARASVVVSAATRPCTTPALTLPAQVAGWKRRGCSTPPSWKIPGGVELGGARLSRGEQASMICRKGPCSCRIARAAG